MAGVKTGVTLQAPFARATVIVVVARKISVTTTVFPDRLKKERKFGVKTTSTEEGIVGRREYGTNAITIILDVTSVKHHTAASKNPVSTRPARKRSSLSIS